MRSVKNHLSLIIALFSIVFTLQVYLIMERVVFAYEVNLNENYKIIVVTQDAVEPQKLADLSDAIKSVEELSTNALISNSSS